MITIKRGTEPPILSGTPSDTAWKDDSVRCALHDMQFDKCCYCEIDLPDRQGNQQIEHFWPQKPYTEKKSKWCNLLIACAECNGTKRKQFPLDSCGNPLLLDPSSETVDPEDHITFITLAPTPDDHLMIGIPYPRDDSPLGESTIRTIQLDGRDHNRFRRDLQGLLYEWYREYWEAFEANRVSRMDHCKSKFEARMDEGREYAAFTRQFVRDWGLEAQGVTVPTGI